jgi:NitT/TauT family transport system substrate-binding protein
MIARVRLGLPALVAVALLATLACARDPAPSGGAARPSAAGAPSAPASGAASSAAPAAPSSPAAQAAPVPIKIAFSQVAAAFAPVWIAHEHGLYRKYGLDPEVVNLAKPADIQALISGDVQITVNGSAGIDAIAGGANLVYIAAPLPIYTQALYGQPGLQKLSDLAGKTVGVTSQGGSSDYALKTLFAREGIDTAQMNLTYLRDDANILAAIQTGTVQAAILTSPNTLRARQAGLHEIINTVPLNLRTINNGIIVRKDWAQQNEELVLGFLKAYMESIKQTKTNPDLAKPIISKYTHMDDPTLLDESYNTSIPGLMVYPLIQDADVQNVIDLSLTPEVKARRPAEYYDNSYLQKLESFVRSLDPDAVPATR